MLNHSLSQSAMFFFCGFLLVVLSAGAADMTGSKWQWQAPEIKATIGYNDNLYGTRQGTLANQSSLVFGIEPTLTGTYGKHLRLQYKARAETFTSAHSEDNIRHNLGLRLQGKENEWRYLIETTQTRVQGESDSVIYDMGRNAVAVAYPRERRNQWQNRSQYSIEWRQQEHFIRTRGRLLYYDLDTRRDETLGHQNFLNRYDLNGGFDFGRAHASFGGDIYFALRHGYTHQGQQGPTASSRTNHYERYFIGWEGRGWEGKFRGVVEAGFGKYRYSNGPGAERLTRPFYRANLSWQMKDNQRLYVEAAEWQWVSSNVTGRGVGLQGRGLSVRFLNYRLGWDSDFANGWQLRNHLHAVGLNYDGVAINDWVYTFGSELNFPVNEHWRAQLGVQLNYGRDEKQKLARSQFSRTLATFSMSRSVW
jgi:hypothetical protein